MADGGIGEAALISAVVGGGVAATQDQDPLKGALLGGLIGAGGYGLMGGAPAAEALVGGAAAPAAAETAGIASLPGAAANPFATQAATQAAQVASTTAATPALAEAQLALGQSAAPSMTTLASQVPAAQSMAGANASSSGLGSLVDKFGALSTPEKLLYGGTAAMAAPTIVGMFRDKQGVGPTEEYSGPLSKFKYDPRRYSPLEVEQPTPYRPVYTDYRSYASGGPIEQMSNANAVGANTGYPMANINHGAYATPYQQPISRNVVSDASDTGVNPITGEMTFASGGISNLGTYSDGGRMLKGPGDGMSDNIPATIAGKQPARLANEEFVVPADVVSHLGNGSSDAGAKQLYKMMDRVRQARTGTKKQGKQIKPEKYLA